MNSNIEHFFSFFEQENQHSPGPIPYSLQYKNQGDFVTNLTFAIHGNEIGPFPAIKNLVQNIHQKKSSFYGTLNIIFGNPQASQRNIRFLEEDLNRVFLNFQQNSLERQRAKEITQCLNHGDLLLDLHQTMEPTPAPFYVYVLTDKNKNFATYLDLSKYAMTIDPKNSFENDAKTIIEYATELDSVAITIELSRLGINPIATSISQQAIERTLSITKKPNLLRNTKNIPSPIQHLNLNHKIPFKHPKMSLKPGLKNLQKVDKDEPIGTDEKGQSILSPCKGFLFFPKYPQRGLNGEAQMPLPRNLIGLAQELVES